LFRDEIHKLGLADMEAINAWLGNKNFLMGSSPCALDCSAFGFLAVVFYNLPETHYFRTEAVKRFPNLKSYVDRIKAIYWEDWDEILSKD
jgi:glutathione S-transferase